MSARIPPEIIGKHRLVAAIRQPAHVALTARLGGDSSDIHRALAQQLAQQLARNISNRIKFSADFVPYEGLYRHAAEVFVFTREELAAVLERHYIVMEPLPRYHERA